MTPKRAPHRAPARGGMIACPPARSRTTRAPAPATAANSAKGRPGALTPAPALDAIFAGAPPSADEWRDIARVLAQLVQEIEGAYSRGGVTRERVLAVTLDGLRREGLPQ
ncbi:MAG: hypothetical protein OXC15_14945 [Rhodospirillaceae bacterium]|nr:hypothetical protein [Rhodospirillaceae bacterium]